MKKILILAVLVGFYTAANCQHHEKRTFLRIFDVSGKAIVRGHLISESQTDLIMRRGSDTLDVPRSDIGKIREGRSVGHYVLIGSVVIIIPTAIVAAAVAASFASMGTLAMTAPILVF